MKLAEGDTVAEVYWIEKGAEKERKEVPYKDRMVSLTKLRVASRDTKGTRTRL